MNAPDRTAAGVEAGRPAEQATPMIDELTGSARVRPGDEAYAITRRGIEALLQQMVVPGQPSPQGLPALALPPRDASSGINQAVVDSMIAEIDRKLSQQVDAILHHPGFQQLESSWRSLKFLVDRTNFRENKLQNAIITNVRAWTPICLAQENQQIGHMEDVSLTYEKVTWTFEPDGIEAEDSWLAPKA